MAGQKSNTDCPVERAGRDIARHHEIREALWDEACRLKSEFARPVIRQHCEVGDRIEALGDSASWSRPESLAGLAVHLMLTVSAIETLADFCEHPGFTGTARQVLRMMRADVRFLEETAGLDRAALGAGFLCPPRDDDGQAVDALLRGR